MSVHGPNQSPTAPSLLDGLNDAQRRAVEHRGSPLIVLAGPGTGKTRVITHRIAHLLSVDNVEPESVVALTFTIKAAGEMRKRLRELVGVSKADRVNASTFHALGMRMLRRFGDTLVPLELPRELRGFDLDALGGALRGGGGAKGTGRAGSSMGSSLTRSGLLDSAQRRRLLRAIIQRGDFLRRHRVLGLDDAANLAGKAIAAMGEHAIEPPAAWAFAEHWRAELAQGRVPNANRAEVNAARKSATGEHGNTSAAPPDAAALRASSEYLKTYADVARVYALYDAAMRRLGLISFSDLVLLPIRLLRQERSYASVILHNEWRHFVVDEFQDVNPAQIELLRALAPPSSRFTSAPPSSADAELSLDRRAGPDLCVVGDDDQSIYAFRGSDERAFAHFAKVWGPIAEAGRGASPGVAQIELSENYRSSSSIVRVAQGVIERAESRFAPEKTLVAAGEHAHEGGPVLGVRVERDEQNAPVILALVRRTWEEWTRSREAASRAPARDGESAPPPSLAVITRSNIEAQRLAMGLRLEGVRVSTASRPSPSEDAGVIDVLSWVELLVNPMATHAAARLLARPPWSVKIEHVAQAGRLFERVREDAAEQARTREPGEESIVKAPESYPEFLASEYARDRVGDAAFASAGEALHTLYVALSADARVHNASEAVRRIIERSGVAHAELLGAFDRAMRVEALVALLRFVRALQPRLEEPGDLVAFWRYYNDLDDEDRKLGRGGGAGDEEQVDGEDSGAGAEVDAGADQGIASEPGAGLSGDGVPLVTVLNAHKAKGLEFDEVFVPRIGATKGCFGAAGQKGGGEDGSIGEGQGRAALPTGLLEFAHPHLDHARATDVEREEERRVFYVACTRARRRLVLLSKAQKSRSSGTHYLQEIEDDVRVSDLVQTLSGRDALALAGGGAGASGASGGLTDAPRTSIASAALAADDLAGGLLEETQGPVERARRSARLQAAAALEACDSARTRESLASALGRLREAGARMAAIGSAAREQDGSLPSWLVAALAEGAEARLSEVALRAIVSEGERLGATAQRSSTSAGSATGATAAGPHATLLTPGVKSPLVLSFTQVNDYRTCPRCYYLKYVLDLRPVEQEREIVGQVVHGAIESFVRARLERELHEQEGDGTLFSAARSRAAPDTQAAPDAQVALNEHAHDPLARERAELLALGAARAKALLGYTENGVPSVAASQASETLTRVSMLLENYLRVFHDPSAHVLEVERSVRMPIDAHWKTRAAAAKLGRRKNVPDVSGDLGDGHVFVAKIDRLDQVTLADGSAGFRIIDYKTGHAPKRLVSPEKSDLQLGLYAVALAHHLGLRGDEPMRGFAEYWLIATGDRGVIALEDLDVDNARRAVLECIAGIRAGRFERGKDCHGDCTLFMGE